MKVKVESVSSVQKKLSVSVPEERVLSEIEEAYRSAAKHAQIPGFRAGKVPRNILEKKFGPSIEAEVYQELIQKTVSDALKENKLAAIRVSEITEPKREKGKGFSYTAAVEVKPDFEPKDYLGLKLEAPKTEVTQKQIDEVFGRLQDAQSVLKHREGATKPAKGDFVSITIEETDEQGNVKPTKEPAKEQIHEVGADLLQPEAEKTIMELKIGESSTTKLHIQNPAREVDVKITLKAIKEKVLPSLDDEFAKSVGPFADMKALRERIEKDLQAEAEEKAKTETSKKILETLVKKNPIDLPETMVHDELHGLIHAFRSRMEQAGMKDLPAEYSDDKLHKEFEPEAKRHVHEQLVLEAIAEKEKISVDEDEVTGRITAMSASAKIPPAELRSYYEKTGRIDMLRFQLLSQKTIDFLLSKATIK